MKILHDIIAKAANIPKNRVVWSGLNAPQPKTPFLTLHLFNEEAEASIECRTVQGNDNYILVVPHSVTLEVQAYAAIGEDRYVPTSLLAEMVRRLDITSIAEELFANEMAVYNIGVIQDVTGLLTNAAQYEPRASVDLNVRYMHITEDDAEIIEKVVVNDKSKEPERKFTISAVNFDGDVT